MADTQFEKVGAKRSLIVVFIALLIAEFFWMLSETHGDFANGILFYVYDHFDIFFILFYPTLFISTYFLGKVAGKDILEFKKGILITSSKCALLLSAIITAYLIIFTLIHQYSILPILLDGLGLFAIFFIMWLCITSLIKWKGKEIPELN